MCSRSKKKKSTPSSTVVTHFSCACLKHKCMGLTLENTDYNIFTKISIPPYAVCNSLPFTVYKLLNQI